MTSQFGDGKEYTQLTNLNMLDTLRIKGTPVGTGPDARVNYVLVKDVTDLPTPIANVIQLVDDFTYEINGDITLGSGDSINTGENNRMFSVNRSTSSIIGAVAGPMMTVEANKELFLQSLSFTNPTGDIIDLNGASAVCEFLGCGADDFVDLATVTGGISRIEFNDGAITNCTNGFMLDGVIESWSMSNNFIGIDVTGTTISLGTSTTDAMALNGNTILSANGMVLISGLVDGANVSTGGIARVDSNNEIGPFTGILTNITALDDGWVFAGNKRYEDTPFTGSMFLQGNATSTNVLDGSYVKVAGTTVEGLSAKFSMTGDNEITYEDAKDIVIGIIVTATITKVGGAAAVYDLAVFKNNVLITNSVISVELKNTASSISLSVTVELSTSDIVDLRIQGSGTTDDVTAPSMQFVVTKS